MARRTFVWTLGAPFALTALCAVASCTSSKAAIGLGSGCSINSDCNGALVCAFGTCHVQCVASKDCPSGATCLPPGVCELPQETTCSQTLPCVSGLTCANDTCRAACTPGVPTGSPGGCEADQSCSSVQGAALAVCLDAGDSGEIGSPDATIDGPGSGEGGGGLGGDGSPGDGSAEANCTLPAVDAGGFPYHPSNFDPAMLAVADGGLPAMDGGMLVSGGAIDWASAPDVNITANCGYSCLPPPVTVTMSDGTTAALFVMHSLTVQSSTTLSLTATSAGTIEQPPAIFAVLTTVDIQGTVNASSTQDVPGPGANGSPGGATPQGAGGGGNGFGSAYPDSSPSGGSYCGVGGAGGYFMPPQAPTGETYGNATIIPLVAGSGGGAGHAGDHFGCGGGALQISAGQSIIVRNVGILSAGGGGAFHTAAGGSGGAILLEAPSVTINGVVAANGGAGGAYAVGPGTYPHGGQDGAPNNIPAVPGTVDGLAGGAGSAGDSVAGGNGGMDTGADAASLELTSAGGGGAGRIRINACPLSLGSSAILSPSLATPCATQGVLQ